MSNDPKIFQNNPYNRVNPIQMICQEIDKLTMAMQVPTDGPDDSQNALR